MDSITDPFFLDWGSSVNVNEDLRRGIRAEIDEIDSSISVLHDNIKTEEKSLGHLTKDLSHAHTELLNLRRFAADDLDNSHMNEQVLIRMRESLGVEVLAVVTPPSSPSEQSPDGIQESNDSSVLTHTTENERKLGLYINKRSLEVKKLASDILKTKSFCLDSKDKIATLEFEIDASAQRVVASQKNNATLNHDIDMKRKEVDAENRRYRAVKESIQNARKRTGDHAQMIAEYSKNLSRNKQNHTRIEGELEADVKSKESTLILLKNDLLSLENIKNNTYDMHETLLQQLVERDEIVEQKEVKVKVLKEQVQHHDSLNSKERNLMDRIKDLEDQLAASKEELVKANEKKNQVNLLASQNDKEEAEVLVPAREELPKILEEKERLARMMNNLHDVYASERNDQEVFEKDNGLKLSSTNKKLMEVKAHLEEKKHEIEAVLQNKSTLIESTEQETLECEKVIENLKEATKWHNNQMKEEVQRREKVLLEKIAKRKDEYSTACHAENSKLRLLENAYEIIKKTEEMEHALNNKAVCLDDDGNLIEESQTDVDEFLS